MVAPSKRFNLVQKIINAHLVSGTPEAGKEVGIKIDLRTPKFLPQSFRDRVLAEAVPV